MRPETTQLLNRLMWDMQAIQLHIESPIVLTSGNQSPIYIDCRKLISSPTTMDFISTSSIWLLQELGIQYDCVAGGETAGIPFATWLSSKTGKSMIYVRKQPKRGGTGSQVEGQLPVGASVLLFEDIITDGGSKINFITGIREVGGLVSSCLVVIDRLQGGSANMKKLQINLHSLTNLDDLLDFGVRGGYLLERNLDLINEYRESPENWHRKRGIPYHN